LNQGEKGSRNDFLNQKFRKGLQLKRKVKAKSAPLKRGYRGRCLRGRKGGRRPEKTFLSGERQKNTTTKWKVQKKSSNRVYNSRKERKRKAT